MARWLASVKRLCSANSALSLPRERSMRSRFSLLDCSIRSRLWLGGRAQGRVPNSGRSVRVRLSSQKPATFIMATRASHMATESSLGGTRVITGPK